MLTSNSIDLTAAVLSSVELVKGIANIALKVIPIFPGENSLY